MRVLQRRMSSPVNLLVHRVRRGMGYPVRRLGISGVPLSHDPDLPLDGCWFLYRCTSILNCLLISNPE